MRFVADDHQAAKAVGASDDCDAAGRIFRCAAFRFSDDGFVRNSLAFEIFPAYASLGVLITAVAAERDDQRRDAAPIKDKSVVETGAVDRLWLAVVFRGTKDGDRVRRRGLILAGVAFDLNVDPAPPSDCARDQHKEQNQGERCKRSSSFDCQRLRFGLALHRHLLTRA